MSIPVVKGGDQKKIFQKSYLNKKYDAENNKIQVRGNTEPHKVAPNSSCIISIDLEGNTRKFLALYNICAADEIGGIMSYMVDGDPKFLRIFVENITDAERLIHINYNCFFD